MPSWANTVTVLADLFTGSRHRPRGLRINPSTPSYPRREIAIISEPAATDIIIDIRHPADVDINPLIAGDNEVIVLAFFDLERNLSRLHPDQSYILYCDKGLMSRIQAQLMREKGFIKVGVFKPK